MLLHHYSPTLCIVRLLILAIPLSRTHFTLNLTSPITNDIEHLSQSFRFPLMWNTCLKFDPFCNYVMCLFHNALDMISCLAYVILMFCKWLLSFCTLPFNLTDDFWWTEVNNFNICPPYQSFSLFKVLLFLWTMFSVKTFSFTALQCYFCDKSISPYMCRSVCGFSLWFHLSLCQSLQ